MEKNNIVLVTGGNGQLGKCLKDYVYERKNDPILSDIKMKFIFLSSKEFDICSPDIEEKLRQYGPKYVANFAAYTNVNEAENNYGDAYRVNVCGAANLAAACVKLGINLIHISTDYVFDGKIKKDERYYPNYAKNPINNYGLSKSLGEDAIIDIFERSHWLSDNKDGLMYTYCINSSLLGRYSDMINSDVKKPVYVGPRYMIIRTSWLYSEYLGNFFTKIIDKVDDLANKDPMMANTFENGEIQVTENEVGSPTYARSLAKYIFWLVNDSKELDYDEKCLDTVGCVKVGRNGIITNFANKGECSRYTFAKYIQSLYFVGKSTTVKDFITNSYIIGERPPKRPGRSVLFSDGRYVRHWMTECTECYNRWKKKQETVPDTTELPEQKY